jgi:hypothetical protein
MERREKEKTQHMIMTNGRNDSETRMGYYFLEIRIGEQKFEG